MLRRLALGVPAALAMCAATTTPSLADFRVCNNTNEDVFVAMSYQVPRQGWTSVGWWTLPSRGCKTVISGRLTSRYFYYLYADSRSGRYWGGSSTQSLGGFCVRPQKFVLRFNDLVKSDGKLDCQSRGLQFKKFRAIEVKTSGTFTYTLLASQDAPSPPPKVDPSPKSEPIPTSTPDPTPAPTPNPTPTAPGGPSTGGTACQRYPNLC